MSKLGRMWLLWIIYGRLPSTGFLKANFDVAIRKSFFVISAFISNDKDEILTACIAKISSMEVNLGVEKAALLASNLASSYGRIPLILKMDSLIVIIGINQQSISISLQWLENCSIIIISFQLSPLCRFGKHIEWEGRLIIKLMLLERQANYRAHVVVAKWAAAHNFFLVLFPIILLFYLFCNSTMCSPLSHLTE